MAGLPRRRSRAAAVCLLMALATAVASAAEDRISTIAGLRAALAAASARTVIRLAPGEYVLDGPLVIPDRVELIGSGRMAIGPGGRATGMQPDGLSVLFVRGAWSGNAIELGHRSALRRLRVVDEAGAGDAATDGMMRNLVVVSSRGPNDVVEASIEDSELVTRQSFGVGHADPLGRAIGVWTRNPRESGPVHTGAAVTLTLRRSVVSAPDSNALMAINFAERGTATVRIRDSRLEGALSAAAGTSRPDYVTGATTTIQSSNTEYLATGGFFRVGWHLFGGSGAPHPGLGSPPGADDNRLRMESAGDRIEGFQVGILAAAGRRVGGLSGPSSGNRLELETKDLVIVTEGERAADVLWYGALAESARGGNERLPPGAGNLMTVRMTRTIGSGPRANRYADLEGAAAGSPDESGNRLQVLGSPAGFRRQNPGVSPAPGDELFIERAP